LTLREKKSRGGAGNINAEKMMKRTEVSPGKGGTKRRDNMLEKSVRRSCENYVINIE
jgi:hypothetical protein